jgi:hypothetical protein
MQQAKDMKVPVLFYSADVETFVELVSYLHSGLSVCPCAKPHCYSYRKEHKHFSHSHVRVGAKVRRQFCQDGRGSVSYSRHTRTVLVSVLPVQFQNGR